MYIICIVALSFTSQYGKIGNILSRSNTVFWGRTAELRKNTDRKLCYT